MSSTNYETLGKLLIIAGIINLVILFATQAFGSEVQIIEIRKNLALKNSDEVSTDYYLNAGENLGLKPGTLFTLYRRVSVTDRLGSTQGKPMAIPVGKIRILYVSRDLSVARLHNLQKFDKSPILEYQSVMLGDVINVGSAESSSAENSEETKRPREVAAETKEPIELKAFTSSELAEDRVRSSLYPLDQEVELVR